VITVIVLDRQDGDVYRRFLPPTVGIVGRSHIYLLYRTEGSPLPQTFADVDGTPLVEMFSFPTSDAAHAWVTTREGIFAEGWVH
jgi:hypothetical protein